MRVLTLQSVFDGVDSLLEPDTEAVRMLYQVGKQPRLACAKNHFEMRRATQHWAAQLEYVYVNADIELLNPLAHFTNTGVEAICTSAIGTLPSGPWTPKGITGNRCNVF